MASGVCGDNDRWNEFDVFFFLRIFFSPYGSCSKEKGNLNYTARACHLVRCYSYFIRSHPLAISAIKVSWNELDKLFFFPTHYPIGGITCLLPVTGRGRCFKRCVGGESPVTSRAAETVWMSRECPCGGNEGQKAICEPKNAAIWTRGCIDRAARQEFTQLADFFFRILARPLLLPAATPPTSGTSFEETQSTSCCSRHSMRFEWHGSPPDLWLCLIFSRIFVFF